MFQDAQGHPEKAQALGKERASLEAIVTVLGDLNETLSELAELAEMAAEENDQEALDDIDAEFDRLDGDLAALEFRRMFQGEMDPANAWLEVQSGSGGTEAQDWAEMLLRMYLKWGEKHGLTTEIVELTPGEVAGIKGATVPFIEDLTDWQDNQAVLFSTIRSFKGLEADAIIMVDCHILCHRQMRC